MFKRLLDSISKLWGHSNRLDIQSYIAISDDILVYQGAIWQICWRLKTFWTEAKL